MPKVTRTCLKLHEVYQAAGDHICKCTGLPKSVLMNTCAPQYNHYSGTRCFPACILQNAVLENNLRAFRTSSTHTNKLRYPKKLAVVIV